MKISRSEIKQTLLTDSIYLIIPVLAAVFTRIVFYDALMASAFKYYSFIKTLDMWTLLKWGVDSGLAGGGVNNLYVMLIGALSSLMNASVFTINAIFIVQLFLGILSVILLFYTALTITKSRLTASLAALILALYSPALMYEGFILKTTLVFFLTLGLIYGIFLFLRKRDSITAPVLCGIFSGLLLCAYFGGLLLFLFSFVLILAFSCSKRFLLSGVFLLSLVVILILFLFAAKFSYIPVVSAAKDSRWHQYIYNVGAQENIKDLNEPVTSGKIISEGETNRSSFALMPYIRKIIMLFSSQEVPDNINYCFIRDGIFPLKYMISPFMLYVFALPGLVIFLLFGKENTLFRISLVSVPAAIAIPLVAFVPLSRYTIYLAPFFAVFAAYLISMLISAVRKKNSRTAIICGAGLVCGVFLQGILNSGDIYRSSDFIAYANALEMQDPNDARINYAYEEAYNFDTSSIPLSLKLADILVERGDFVEALEVLENIKGANPAENAFISKNIVSLKNRINNLKDSKSKLSMPSN